MTRDSEPPHAPREDDSTHPFTPISEQPSKRPSTQPFEAGRFEARLRGLQAREPFRFPSDLVPEHFKRSSVLICFWRDEADLRVLLTTRAASLRGHPGQMSFPGGQLEAHEDWIAGALRETEEEVGIPRTQVEVLGRLDDAWSGAGHLLVPIVGWLADRPTLIASPDEVAAIHTPSVSALLDPNVYTREATDLGGEVYFNSTLRWREGRKEASVFGLSSDLLIEAIQWAIGLEAPHGPGRLANLTSWLRFKAEQSADC